MNLQVEVRARLYKPWKYVDKWEYEYDAIPELGLRAARKKAGDSKSEEEAKKYGRAEAQKEIVKLLAARAEAAPVAEEPKKSKAPTFDAFQAEYIEDWKVEGFKSSPTSKKGYYKRHLKPVIGTLALDALLPTHVKQIKRNMRKAKKSSSTINNALNELIAILNAATEAKLIGAKPCKVKRVPVNKKDPCYYTREEFAAMLREADAATQLVLLLGAHAGLRRAEICGLMWTDISLENKTVRVSRTLGRNESDDDEDDEDDDEGLVEGSTKSRQPRTVDLSDDLIAALQRTPKRGFRVLYEADGSELRGPTVTDWVVAVCAKAGLPVKGHIVHKLRHTFCTWLSEDGVPIRTIQELAGHYSVLVTQRYMWCSPRAGRDAVRGTFNRGLTSVKRVKGRR